MIDSLTIDFDQFDLRGFIKSWRDFCRSEYPEIDDIDSLMYSLSNFSSPPLPFDSNNDPIAVVGSSKKMLFLPFHVPVVNDEVACLDGVHRAADEFDIDISDLYGYLLESHDNMISIHPALYDGTSNFIPRIDLQASCATLDDGMNEFRSRFLISHN